MCVGKLPKEIPHGLDKNTHRLCFKDLLPNDEIFDVQVNKGDIYWLELLIDPIKKGE